MAISSCDYNRLTSLQRKWGMSQEDIFYAIENGILRVCVWMPLRYIERFIARNKTLISEKHEPQEGFVRLRPEDCHRICSSGHAEIKVFESLAQENNILRLAYELPQPPVSVSINDIVVLNDDIKKFEQRCKDTEKPDFCKDTQSPQFSSSNDYRYVKLNNQEFHFGEIQASIIRQLHEAAKENNPWLHGKTLLRIAGSGATRLRDLFKNRKTWGDLIVSTGRGYYRLNIEMANIPAFQCSKGQGNAALKFLAYVVMLVQTQLIPTLDTMLSPLELIDTLSIPLF